MHIGRNQPVFVKVGLVGSEKSKVSKTMDSMLILVGQSVGGIFLNNLFNKFVNPLNYYRVKVLKNLNFLRYLIYILNVSFFHSNRSLIFLPIA